MGRLEMTAEKVASNAMLAALARIVMLVGVPVALAIAGAYAGEITGLHRKVQLMEVQQAQIVAMQNAAAGRLSALETQNVTEAGRFSVLEREIASMSATVNAMNRNVDRVLNRLDGNGR